MVMLSASAYTQSPSNGAEAERSERTFGGVASLNIVGNQANEVDNSTRRRADVVFSPYIIRPDDGSPGFRYVAARLLYRHYRRESDQGVQPAFLNEDRRATVEVALGRRFTFWQRGPWLLAGQFGIGPSIGFDWDRFENTISERANAVVIGANARANLLIGYDVLPRLRIIASVLSASAQSTIDVSTDVGLSAYALSAGINPGLRFGVEWIYLPRGRRQAVSEQSSED